jgi:hypothetical protein
MRDDLNGLLIPLTQGRSVLVSEEDYPALVATKWHAVLCHKRWYARRAVKRGGKVVAVYMHRQIMGLDASDAGIVDHINGDGLDNTRKNLRVTTHSQNSMNIQSTRGRTGLRGVYLQGGNYIVRIAKEYFGCYATEAEAAFHANRALDAMSPGAGMRNPVDADLLLSIWRSRKAELDSLIAQISGGHHDAT